MQAPTSSARSLLLLGLLALFGCAAKAPPAVAPAPVRVCATIPTPARPALPAVVLPAPDDEGRYCLTQQQVNDLAAGIRALTLYADQVDAAVRVHNERTHPQGGK